MKCKPLALRVLSTAAMLSIVASCTAPAFAATYDLSNGDVSVSAEADGYQYVSQWTDEDHTTFATDENGTIDHRKDNDVTLTSNGQETSNTITVSADKDQTANVTLDDVNIDTRADKDSISASGDAAMTIKGDGDVTVELDGKNTLTSGYGNAGLEKNRSESTGQLTLKDDNDASGSLTATGGVAGAGIGGSVIVDAAGQVTGGNATENIEITGGDVTALGGYEAAGIGSSYTSYDNFKSSDYQPGSMDVENISITGGTVTAVGGAGGAGIGSGLANPNSEDSFNPSPKTSSVKNISASDCTLNVTGGAFGAGIGSGYVSTGDVSGIHLSNLKNSSIQGGVGSAGIGSGMFVRDAPSDTKHGTVDDISIADSNLTIAVSSGGTGIGADYRSTLADGAITISGTSDITIKKADPDPTFSSYLGSSSFIGNGGSYTVSDDGESIISLDGSEKDATLLCESKVTYVNEDGTIEKVISGKGHTWGEWETVKEATETDTGLQQRVCQVCGKVEQRELPKLTPAEPDPAPVPTPVPPTDDKPTDNGTETQTSSEDLWVEAPDGIPQTFTVTQNGSVRTYTSPYDSGTLTGSLEVLQKLQESGTDTITFVTNQRTSSFKVADLLALGSDGEMLALSHMDAAAPTLTVAGADHTTLLF